MKFIILHKEKTSSETFFVRNNFVSEDHRNFSKFVKFNVRSMSVVGSQIASQAHEREGHRDPPFILQEMNSETV